MDKFETYVDLINKIYDLKTPVDEIAVIQESLDVLYDSMNSKERDEVSDYLQTW